MYTDGHWVGAWADKGSGLTVTDSQGFRSEKFQNFKTSAGCSRNGTVGHCLKFFHFLSNIHEAVNFVKILHAKNEIHLPGSHSYGFRHDSGCDQAFSLHEVLIVTDVPLQVGQI